MIVTITRNTVADKQPVFVGDVLELDDAEARMLVRMGKAVEYTEDALDVAESAAIDAEPEPTDAPHAAPKRRKGK